MVTMERQATTWPRVPISSAYAGLYDGPHATPKPSIEGPIFLGIGNITEDGHLDLSNVRHIAEQDFPKWTRRVEPRPGDIVFVYEAALNRYAIIPDGFRGCLGRRLALIRPDPEMALGQFLFYYFFSEDWRRTIAKNTLSGATVDRIPLTTFPTFELDLPSLETQEKIVAILTAYDDLIENNTRRIGILEEMARSMYREWFVNFRFPGHHNVEMVDSPIGPVPKRWSVKRLGDEVELAYGKALKAVEREDGPVPVYGSSGVVGHHSAGLVDGPGVIVGRKGNVGSVHWSDYDFYPIDTVFYVRTAISLFYVYFNFKTQNFLNNDAAVPGLNRNQAYSLSLLVPDEDTLAAFDDWMQPVFAQVRNLREKNAVLRRTRDLLLPKLISGKLEVSDLDIGTGELSA